MVTMTDSATEASAGLMRLAAEGDEVAFARIVDAYQADMSRVCFVVTGGDAELTAEAVQSAWPIAWRKLDTIREPERLRPWLISIAVNEARQLARRRRRGRVLEDLGRDGSDRGDSGSGLPCRRHRPSQCPGATEARGPRAHRAALRRRASTPTELARAMGMSPSGTRARLARLLGRLRSELGDG